MYVYVREREREKKRRETGENIYLQSRQVLLSSSCGLESNGVS